MTDPSDPPPTTRADSAAAYCESWDPAAYLRQ